MPKIHPLPILILLIFSIFLIAIGSQFKKETPLTENFFIGAKNVIDEIVQGEDGHQKFFAEKTQNLPEKYAIYIKDLKSQKVYELNSKEIFPAASIYKLAVMYTAYDRLEKGTLSKKDTLSASQQELDIILSPEEDPDEGNPLPTPTPDPNQEQTEISNPVAEALRLMITISDNYSAILLAQKLGWENIDKYMEEEGLPEIDLVSEGSPFISAETAGRLLEKIYSHQAVSFQASEEMLQLLSSQKINDRIPKYLPPDTKVAHKTGEIENVRNDAGIVYGKKSDYIFVFLSQTDEPLDAAETIANLSRDFYKELEK